VVGLLAHWTPVIANHVAGELARHRATNGTLFYDGGYIDDGDYVLLGQIPKDDYSRGGVYFIGASEMKASIMPWLLPPSESRLIHEYSIGDFRHREVRHYLRSLIEEQGLLQAGGQKTTVILSLCYLLARKKDLNIPLDRYVELLFERHHFYTYDWNKGIHRVGLSSVERFLRLQRDFANRFLRFLILSPSRVRPYVPPDEWKRKHLISVMGSNWQEQMKADVQDLAELLDYLQKHNVRVRALFPPSGSWDKELPYEAAYREMVGPILASHNVPISDYGDFLPDEEFGDDIHARYSGQLKLHPAYRDLALQALSEMGTRLEPETKAQSFPAPDHSAQQSQATLLK
jgi:hypothetical protein